MSESANTHEIRGEVWEDAGELHIGECSLLAFLREHDLLDREVMALLTGEMLGGQLQAQRHGILHEDDGELYVSKESLRRFLNPFTNIDDTACLLSIEVLGPRRETLRADAVRIDF